MENSTEQNIALERVRQSFDFLELLHRGGQFRYIWTPNTGRYYQKDGKRTEAKESIWFRVGTLPNIPANWIGKNVYFGVNPTARPGADYQRTALNPQKASPRVVSIGCLFAEFDAKDFGSKAAIYAYLDTVEPKPTATIDSGGGVHCYWALKEPLKIDTDDDRRRARSIQYRWVDFIGGDPASKDLTRVLRLPGFQNRKAAYGPDYPTVDFVSFNSRRLYDIDDLESLLPAETERPKVEICVTGDLAREIESALQAIDGIDLGYDRELSILMAVHSAMGDDGIGLCERYLHWGPANGETIAQKFSGFDAGGGISIATLFSIASQYGYIQSEGLGVYRFDADFNSRADFLEYIHSARVGVTELNFGDYVPKDLQANYRDGRIVYRTGKTDRAVADALLDLASQQGTRTVMAGGLDLARLAGLGSNQTAAKALARLSGWFIEPAGKDGSTPRYRIIFDYGDNVARSQLIPSKEKTVMSCDLATSSDRPVFSKEKATDPFISGKSKTNRKRPNKIKPLGGTPLIVINALESDATGTTRAELAENTGLSIYSVRAAIRKLSKYGLIEEEKQGNGAALVFLADDWRMVISQLWPMMETYMLSAERGSRHTSKQIAFCERLIAHAKGDLSKSRLILRKARLEDRQGRYARRLGWIYEFDLDEFEQCISNAEFDRYFEAKALDARERQIVRADIWQQIADIKSGKAAPPASVANIQPRQATQAPA